MLAMPQTEHRITQMALLESDGDRRTCPRFMLKYSPQHGV